MDQQSDEQYVRSKWHAVDIVESCDQWQVGAGELGIQQRFGWEQTKSAAWSAAAAFTRNREEQIRQLCEEIVLVEIAMESASEELNFKPLAWHIGQPMRVHRRARWGRILAREQAALAELKKGMKP